MQESPTCTPPQAQLQKSGRRSNSGRTYSKKRKRTVVRAEDKENWKEGAAGVKAGEEVGFVDVAYQFMATENVLSADELQESQETPSRKRARRSSQPSKPTALLQEEEQHEGRLNAGAMVDKDTDDTIIVYTPETRTSGRQRKTTWKVAEALEEPLIQSTVSSTPISSMRSRHKPGAALSPMIKDPAKDGRATLQTTTAVTPTPKRRGRPPKRKPADPVAPIEQVTEASSEKPTQPILGLTPSKTTSTPRRRGRPPKDKSVDDLICTPAGLSIEDTPTKRRFRAANTGQSVTALPALAGQSAPSTPSKRGLNSSAYAARINPVNWEQSKEDVVAPQTKPNTGACLEKLMGFLGQESYKHPLSKLKSGLLNCLTGKKRLQLQGVDEGYQKVHQVVQQTVAAGEGNSMLLIGPRGSGKTALVESIVAEMTTEFHDDFYVIRLNGFIHTDDKLALKEIWRQLGRKMEVEDDSMAERSNYADTLQSLLAVLSHPTQQEEHAHEETRAAKSLVFIIDEFDLFASHPRQTLLYNLFDIAQSSRAPIAVLGLTTRVDIAESLEKRVKSRFSHRHVFLPRPKSFHAFQQICLMALTAGSVESIPLVGANAQQEESSSNYRILHSAWCDYITSLFHESTALTSLLRYVYATSRSVPTALAAFLLPICALSPTCVPDDASFASQALLPPDSKLALLPSLTDIELALLIAAARLDIILDVDTCNFNMAYDEYNTLANRMRVQTSASGTMAVGGGARIWSRETALRAWERLEILELIMPLATAGYGAGSGLADVGRSGKLMRCDVSLEEIKWSGLEMSSMMAKWCKEI